jgi:type IV pilus assembly protein PilA
MRRRTSERRDVDAGFTLIELLVVIIVIGVLAGIAMPAYLGQRRKAWRTQAVADMKNAAVAIESYATDPGRTYIDLNGATETSPLLQSEGFRTASWVGLRVVSTTLDYCIEGIHVYTPGITYTYRSWLGEVEVVGVNGVLPC